MIIKVMVAIVGIFLFILLIVILNILFKNEFKDV